MNALLQRDRARRQATPETATSYSASREVLNLSTTLNTLAGFLAYSATVCSPYPAPIDLGEAIADFCVRFDAAYPSEIEGIPDFKYRTWASYQDLYTAVSRIVEETPLMVAWNTPKVATGQTIRFTSRYDGPGNPDHDFIDLGALARNAANETWRDSAEFKEFNDAFEAEHGPLNAEDAGVHVMELVEPARPAPAAEVREISPTVAAVWYRAHGLNVDPSQYECRVYAAFNGADEPIGMATVLLNIFNPWVGRTCDSISSVLVDPASQGLGYGRALMQHIVPQYSELALTVLRDNAPAIRLYESCDFKIVGDGDRSKVLMMYSAAERASAQGDLFNVAGKPSYGYISAAPLLERASQIRSLAERAGIIKPLPSEKLHATVMYDPSNPVRYSGHQRNRQFEVTVIGHTVLGAGGDRTSLALTLQSSDLKRYHQELEQLGFRHSHETFQPHMTLRYNPRPKDVQALAENIHLFRGLTFSLFERPWRAAKASA